jgi:hypothetical protein
MKPPMSGGLQLNEITFLSKPAHFKSELATIVIVIRNLAEPFPSLNNQKKCHEFH